MGKIIAIVNQKGGVGKTTTAINLGAALAHSGKKCLDRSGRAGERDDRSRFSRELLEYTSFELLASDIKAEELVYKSTDRNMDIIPGSEKLVNLETALLTSRTRIDPSGKLKPLAGKYDFILIDCAPSLGVDVENALCCGFRHHRSSASILPTRPCR